MIDDYTDDELTALIRWIESDDMPRTKEELLASAIAQLGFPAKRHKDRRRDHERDRTRARRAAGVISAQEEAC